MDQAVSYLVQIDEICTTLQANPELGRERPEIRPQLRSIAMAQHIIFYRLLCPNIRIVRILHASRDLTSLFR